MSGRPVTMSPQARSRGVHRWSREGMAGHRVAWGMDMWTARNAREWWGSIRGRPHTHTPTATTAPGDDVTFALTDDEAKGVMETDLNH